MAETVKSLRRRLRSIRNTKQITRAMEMVSAAKLRRAQHILLSGRPYAAKLQELLARLASTSAATHPFFEKRDVRMRTLVLVTADRGLAGSFNAQVIKRAEAILNEAKEPTELVCIGKKGYDYFKTRTWPIKFSTIDLAGKLSSERSNELANRLVEMYLAHETDEILLLYNTFVSTLVYRPTLEQMLPLDSQALSMYAEESEGASTSSNYNIDYIMSPSSEEVLRELLPRFILSKVYITLAEVFAAEHSARMVAMSAATKNSQELIDAVSLKMNKARQASITKEILEIVGGAEALKG